MLRRRALVDSLRERRRTVITDLPATTWPGARSALARSFLASPGSTIASARFAARSDSAFAQAMRTEVRPSCTGPGGAPSLSASSVSRSGAHVGRARSQRQQLAFAGHGALRRAACPASSSRMVRREGGQLVARQPGRHTCEPVVAVERRTGRVGNVCPWGRTARSLGHRAG